MELRFLKFQHLPGATYVISTGVLSITTTDMLVPGADAAAKKALFDTTKIKITGQGDTATALLAHTGDNTDSTVITAEPTALALEITLKGTHKATIDGLLARNGTSAVDGTTYKIAFEAGVNSKAPLAVDNNAGAITVSKGVPTIVSGAVTIDSTPADTKLVLTGYNLPTRVNEWDQTKLVLQGKGNTDITVTSQATATNAHRTSSWAENSVTIKAIGNLVTAFNALYDENGKLDGDGNAYNVVVSAAFATVDSIAGLAQATVPVTVSGR